MKKLLYITIFFLVTASSVFTSAGANEYMEAYIRPDEKVEVRDQLVTDERQIDSTSYDNSEKADTPHFNDVAIKLLPERSDVVNSYGLKLFGEEGNIKGLYRNNAIRIKVEVTEYKANSVTAGDILSVLPVVAIKNEQTLGVVIPPFAYFAKKF